MLKSLKHLFGPSTLVTAAFIGPGTLTICTLAGANAGYALLWALLFSVLATITLQEMSARLGLITQAGLGEAIRKELSHPVLKWAGIILILSAIVIGNAAYEAGNISGAVLGTQQLVADLTVSLGDLSLNLWLLVIFGIAFWLLNSGTFKRIQRFLVVLVIIMSVVFLVTAILVKPDITAIFRGFLPSATSPDDFLLAIALIGTTVVPYNLFLHASSVKEKWKNTDDIGALRAENRTAILTGGFISMAIVITSAAAVTGGATSDVQTIQDMAEQLKPSLGNLAPAFLGTGMFAAGISSAVTAPLAAAYAASGILGWESGLRDRRFKAVWLVILLLGTLFSSLGYKPVEVIQFAQVANGLLLPVIAVFLIYIMNKKSLLEHFTNSRLQNAIGLVVVLITLFISFRTLNSVFNLI
jgi:Mn2+/Fe2+ NRAMP family transporter